MDADRISRRSRAAVRLESIRRAPEPTRLDSTAWGRATMVTAVAMVLGLTLPWAGRNSDNVRTAAGVSALGAVVGVVFIAGAVCIVHVVGVPRRRDPSAAITVGTGAAAIAAMVQTWSRFRDWYGDDVRLLGPTVVVGAAVALVGIGAANAIVTRRQTNARHRSITPPSVDELERALQQVEQDAARPHRSRMAGLAAPVTLVVAWFMWFVGVLGAWVTVSVPGRFDSSFTARTSGIDIPETSLVRTLLVVAAMTGSGAFVWRRRRQSLLVVSAILGIAGTIAAVQSAATVSTVTEQGAIDAGWGAYFAIVGAATIGLVASAHVVGHATARNATSRHQPWPVGGLVAAAAVAVSVLAGVATVPTPAVPSSRDGLTVIGGGDDALLPTTRIAASSVSGALFAGDALFIVDRYDGTVYSTIGGRLGPIVDGTSDADQIVGVVGSRIVYRHGDSVYSTAFGPAAGDDSFRGANMTLALTARDPVLGPDGSLWYNEWNSDPQPGLHRIADASNTDPTDDDIDVPATVRLVGAGTGRAYGWVDDDRRLVAIDTDSGITTIIGGVGDPTCGPSTDALRTAVDDVERVTEDGAGNVWIDIADGGALWVVRASDGAVVQPGAEILRRLGATAGSDGQLLALVESSSPGVVALWLDTGPGRAVVRVDEAPAIVADLDAAAPVEQCRPISVAGVDAPSVRRLFGSTDGLDSTSENVDFVLPDLRIEWGEQTVIEHPDSEVIVDNPQLQPAARYPGFSGDGGGGAWWIADDGPLVHVDGTGEVTTVSYPSADGEFYAFEAVAGGVIALGCTQSETSCDDDRTLFVSGDGSVTTGPALSTNDNRAYIGPVDFDGNRVVVVGDDRVSWLSLDGGFRAVADEAGSPRAIGPDGELYVSRFGQLVRIDDDGAETSITAEYDPGDALTLAQLERSTRELSIDVRFAAVGDDGTVYVVTGDDVILALHPSGTVRYVTGGGRYVDGATGGSASFGDLHVVDDTLFVDTADDILEIDLSSP